MVAAGAQCSVRHGVQAPGVPAVSLCDHASKEPSGGLYTPVCLRFRVVLSLERNSHGPQAVHPSQCPLPFRAGLAVLYHLCSYGLLSFTHTCCWILLQTLSFLLAEIKWKWTQEPLWPSRAFGKDHPRKQPGHLGWDAGQHLFYLRSCTRLFV